jgi:hypothetical protein
MSSIAYFCTIMHDIDMPAESPAVRDKPLLILIAGPYLSGTDGDPEKITRNRERLESFALPIYERGHLPMIGEWLALPLIHAAGGQRAGDEIFRTYQYPVAHRLLQCCDALLRIPGASKGADLDVARAIELGLPVYRHLSELPKRTDAVGEHR